MPAIMKTRSAWVKAAGGVTLLLGPAIVVLAAPFASGIEGELGATPWLAPAALLLAAAIAFNASRRGAAQQAAAQAAAKSIT
jgi:hypothetical protein